MKTRSRLGLPALLSLFLLAPAAHAQVSITTAAFVGSPYVWRGEVLSQGWVVQPTVTASYNGLYATFFGNFDPEGTGLASGNARVNEADLSLGYGATLNNVALGAGYTFYTFPTPGAKEISLLASQEFFASAGLTSGAVQPSLFVAYDFDENEENALQGLYAEAKVGVPVDLGGQAFGLAAGAGLDSGYLLADENTGLSHLFVTASTAFEAGPISLSPMIGFQASVDDVYVEAFGQTVLYGGFTVGF